MKNLRDWVMGRGGEGKSPRNTPAAACGLRWLICPLLLLFSWTAFAWAEEPLLDYDWNKLRGAKSVLKAGPGGGWIPGLGTGEDAVLRRSCLYRTEDPQLINGLVDVLKDMELRLDPKPPVMYQGRNMDEEHKLDGAPIIFTLANGAEVRFVMSHSKWFLIDLPQYNGTKLTDYPLTEAKLRKFNRSTFRWPPATVLDPAIVTPERCEIIRRKMIFELGM